MKEEFLSKKNKKNEANLQNISINNIYARHTKQNFQERSEACPFHMAVI
jgi:hypothetical protein